MGTHKREPSIEDLMSDPLMIAVLRHARKSPEEMRATLCSARDRMVKANNFQRGQEAGSADGHNASEPTSSRDRGDANHGRTAMTYSFRVGHGREHLRLLSRLTQRIFATILGDHVGSG
jgi:hypothetical protein